MRQTPVEERRGESTNDVTSSTRLQEFPTERGLRQLAQTRASGSGSARDEQDGTPPLPTDGEALDEAQATSIAGAQYPTEAKPGGIPSRTRRTDDDDRCLQRGLPAEPVTDLAEDDAAERAGDEADGVRDERGDEAVERRARRREKNVPKTRLAAVA